MSPTPDTLHLFNAKGRIIDLSSPIVMGILNATPDSFYNRGKGSSVQEILEAGGKMLEEGATILDVGGASSRPGAKEIEVAEELERTVPVIEALRKNYPDCIISIDSCRAEVGKECLLAGADIVNDISGGDLDHNLLNVVARLRSPYILMHMKGTPANMQTLPTYKKVTQEVLDYFISKIDQLNSMGIYDIIIDPGFGFGKTIAHNFKLLYDLKVFQILNKPILAGISRKRMICEPLKCTPEEALNGTTAAHMLALNNGATILRAHDVREAIECIYLYGAYKANGANNC